MDFKELGAALKQERERQGLSLEVVMESTKISRSNIVAIENGDRSALPHPVYAKGFIKSYARFLGLDHEEFSMVVDREYQDDVEGPEEQIYEVSPAAEKAFQDSDAGEKKRRSIWPMFLILLVLVVAGVLIFMNLKPKETGVPAPEVQQQEMEQPEELTPSVPAEIQEPIAEPGVSLEEPSEVVEPEVEETVETVEQSQETAEEAVVPAEEPAAEETPLPQTEVPDEPVVEKAEETETVSPEEQIYDHVLIIRATTEKGCWVGVWKGDDTEMSSDFVLQKGEPLRLLFNSPRRIRIGNVAGVVVTYNGEPFELDENRSNIQTLRFGF